MGDHWIKGWSRTQKAVALSSAEAELVAMTKVTAEAIGVSNLSRDWGRERRITIFADSAAALGIAERRGSGKLRHINVGLLWVQEKRAQDEVDFRKVEGTKNPADLMTKHLSSGKAVEHTGKLGIEFRSGRAAAGLEVSHGKG